MTTRKNVVSPDDPSLCRMPCIVYHVLYAVASNLYDVPNCYPFVAEDAIKFLPPSVLSSLPQKYHAERINMISSALDLLGAATETVSFLQEVFRIGVAFAILILYNSGTVPKTSIFV